MMKKLFKIFCIFLFTMFFNLSFTEDICAEKGEVLLKYNFGLATSAEPPFRFNCTTEVGFNDDGTTGEIMLSREFFKFADGIDSFVFCSSVSTTKDNYAFLYKDISEVPSRFIDLEEGTILDGNKTYIFQIGNSPDLTTSGSVTLNFLPYESEKYFAIGDDEYSNLYSAIQGATSKPATIKLLSDYDLSNEINAAVSSSRILTDLTLDLNGFTLSNSGEEKIKFRGNYIIDNLSEKVGEIQDLCFPPTDYSIATLKNGCFSNLVYSGHGEYNIIGGYFDAKYTEYISDLYEFIDNTDEGIDSKYKYKVVKKNFAVGDKYYLTFAEAVAAANNSEDHTIVLLKDATEGNLDALLTSGITFDLNGHVLTVNSMANIGGIIKDSGSTKGSLSCTNTIGFAGLYEKKESTDLPAFIPVKVADNKYQFYETPIGYSIKSHTNNEVIVGSFLANDIADKVFTFNDTDEITSGVGLGLRVGMSLEDADKNSYSFSANIVKEYSNKTKGANTRPYFKLVGLGGTDKIFVNGFVTNKDVGYRYDGITKEIELNK